MGGSVISTTSFSFTIQGDNEGYVTFSCPYCHSDFKLQAGEFQNDNEPFIEAFCPYCGLTKDLQSFYSEDVREKAKAIVMNYMVEELNKSLGRLKRSFNQKSSIIKVSFKPLKKVNVKELKETDNQETEFECNFCKHHVKVLYCAGSSKIFCPYCGVDI